MKTTRLTGVRGMWYVESSNPEFGAMPTLSVASIDTSEGYHRPTKLKFDSTTKTGFKKAKNFGGEDYWKAMGVTPHIALTLNRDETGEPRAYLGVFRVSNFKLDEEPVIGEPVRASITIHEMVAAVPDRDAPISE